jgi:hypothetical protein
MIAPGSGLIRSLIKHAALQLDLFDERNLFASAHTDYPGERRVCTITALHFFIPFSTSVMESQNG